MALTQEGREELAGVLAEAAARRNRMDLTLRPDAIGAIAVTDHKAILRMLETVCRVLMEAKEPE